MPIICLGISHHTAPVELRERWSLSPAAQRELLAEARWREPAERLGLRELAILSTCNRTEIYAAADAARRFSAVPDDAVALLADLGADDLSFAPHRYAHAGAAALRHLCAVAAGLDSMVLGESEILGQVAAAEAMALATGASGPVLQASFQTALRAGRRARAETAVGRHTVSMGTEAARIAEERGLDPARATVVIIGTGKMGRIVGEAMRARGATRLRVVSHTAEHAAELAASLGATALAWHDLSTALRGAEVIVSCTGAPHAVLTYELLRSARQGTGGRPALIVDLAVPRDVEPTVRQLPGVALFDIDDLTTRLAGHVEARRREVPRVHAIIEDEVAHFEAWRRGAELRPLLSALHTRSEAIRQRELERMLRRLGDISPEVRHQVELFSQSLVAKLLHEPTDRLRAERDPERGRAYQSAARELFGLVDGAQSELIAS